MYLGLQLKILINHRLLLMILRKRKHNFNWILGNLRKIRRNVVDFEREWDWCI